MIEAVTDASQSGLHPISRIAVDLATRMGAVGKVTPMGLPTLENMLVGGLRSGDFLSISGAPGIGKTSLALFLGYIAARSKAAALVVSPTLTEDLVIARLASRALHREDESGGISYGDIWSGRAWTDDRTIKRLRRAVDTVVTKVGVNLHVVPMEPFTRVSSVAERVATLWGKHERIVVVVDGLEAFFPSEGGADPARVAYELRRLASQGCAVVSTTQPRDAEAIAGAATLAAELRPSTASTVGKIDPKLISLGARNLDLVITKNHIGPSGMVPLRFIGGVATFEERAP